MPWNFSKTQDEAAALTGVATFASLYLIDGEPVKSSLGYALLASLAVLGYTGYSKGA